MNILAKHFINHIWFAWRCWETTNDGDSQPRPAQAQVIGTDRRLGSERRGERGETDCKVCNTSPDNGERERPRATHDLRIKPSDVLPGGTGYCWCSAQLPTKIGYDSFITLIGREGDSIIVCLVALSV